MKSEGFSVSWIMKKILAVGASTSRSSINRSFASFAASSVEGAEAKTLDLSSYSAPIYSVDEEQANGIPEEIVALVAEIESCDGLVVSLAEHNGSYAAGFKSILDWATRHKKKVWSEKPMLLLSASPGGRGGATVLEAAKTTFPRLGGKVVSTFSLPSFGENFSPKSGVADGDLRVAFEEARDAFAANLTLA